MMNKLSEEMRAIAKAWRKLSILVFNKISVATWDEMADKVVLLEDVVEVAKKIDSEWYMDYDLCPEEILELHDALAKLEDK